MNKLKKAERVLVSQGRSKLLASSTMAQYVDRLAALCNDDGTLKPDTPARFEAVWYEHIDRLNELKATDAETEVKLPAKLPVKLPKKS